MTPLQQRIRDLAEVFAGAREELDDASYTWLVAIALELALTESERLGLGEALREQRRAA